MARFQAQHAHITELKFRGFPANAANTAGKALDAEEIMLRILLSQGGEERAVAAANIDFHWTVAPEQFGEIESNHNCPRELGFALVQPGAVAHPLNGSDGPL